MTQCYLKLNSPERSRIGGLGDFGQDLPALPVSESIANQYDTDELRAHGWIVTRVADDHTDAESTKKKSK